MRPIRVLYLIDSLGPGGAQRQLVTLVRSLDRELVAPEVAVYHPLDHFRPELEAVGVPVHLLRGLSGRDPRVLLGLSRLIGRGGYDLVHSYLRTPGTLARLAVPSSRATKVIVSERNEDLGHSQLRLGLERLLSRRAVAMIANADAIAREVTSLVPSWAGRVHVVPNGIDWSAPTSAEQAAAVEFRERHVGDADRLLAVVGRIEKQKAPDLLFDALERLPGDVLARLRVVWVGPRIDRGLADAIESRLASSDLAGRLEFMGETRDTRSVYLGADGIVLCSRWEGLPNVVLEAMAHGRPVVATDAGDTGILVKGGPGRWLVPPDDPAALASALIEFSGTSEEELAALGRKGSELVLEDYSALRLAERTVEVYQEVMGSELRTNEWEEESQDA